MASLNELAELWQPMALAMAAVAGLWLLLTHPVIALEGARVEGGGLVVTLRNRGLAAASLANAWVLCGGTALAAECEPGLLRPGQAAVCRASLPGGLRGTCALALPEAGPSSGSRTPSAKLKVLFSCFTPWAPPLGLRGEPLPRPSSGGCAARPTRSP